ncbi:MAG: phosphoribosylamine--glycine ligase [Pseudomonadota bacterium]
MSHNVFILGSGGREHALCLKLSKSIKVKALYYSSGPLKDNLIPNPAMVDLAEYVSLDILDGADIVAFCKNKAIDLVVIGPEAPAAAGIADILTKNNISVFGPTQAAAQLEASKAFTKDLCKEASIPTAAYHVYDDLQSALEGLDNFSLPVVIKADGLASGKGVVIAHTKIEAEKTINDMFDGAFGIAGAKIVLEEFLSGEEASFFVLSDGENIIPLTSAQDHKAAYDGDKGPNTGGMGAYSPAPIMTDIMTEKVIETIIKPTLVKMQEKGTPFKGVLYAGLMIVEDQPYLIEYNVRFGDPECQVIMERLTSDLFDLLYGAATSLENVASPKWSEDYALTVVMASEGYPAQPVTGQKIVLPDRLDEKVTIYHAGTSLLDKDIISTGGRVLNVTAYGKAVSEACMLSYKTISDIRFDQSFYRKDIGHRALTREDSLDLKKAAI